MDIERKAKRLLKAVDNVYTVPAYSEDRVLQAFMRELKKIKREENEENDTGNNNG